MDREWWWHAAIAGPVLASSDDRDGWLAARRRLVTGSEVAKLFGDQYSAQESASQMFADKLAGVERWDPWAEPDDPRNQSVVQGNCFESGLGRYVGWLTRQDLTPCGVLIGDPECERHGSTPDFCVADYRGRGTAVVDTKWSRFGSKTWLPEGYGGNRLVAPGDRIPRYYYWQLQSQLAVTGFGLAVLAVYHRWDVRADPQNVVCYHVERNDRDIQRLRRECMAQWPTA